MTETPHTLLLRLCHHPAERDWQRFVALFTPLLLRWVRRLHVPERDTEDLLQELFMLLWQQLPTFAYDPTKSFHAWLWTVTHRMVRDWLRRREPRPLANAPLAEVAAPDAVALHDNEEFAKALVERGLAVIQADFTPTTWAIFTAIAIDDRPGTEVARTFNTTPNAVYLAYSRVLHRLRTELVGFLE